MLTRSDFLVGSAATALAAASLPQAPPSTDETALDRYVALPTPEYRYDVIATIDRPQYRVSIVSMVSQQWRSAAEVDNPLWQHWLTIVEPKPLATRVATLFIRGGSIAQRPPRDVDPSLTGLAVATGGAVVELFMDPNEPLTFAGETAPLLGDRLVAYTWQRYFVTGDETWPIRLPMTKAAVRAMDTVTALSFRAGQSPVIDRFVVCGASKRGWTAWLTAAVDRRVIGIVPMVIDTLDVEASAIHAYRVYGFWPPTLQSYVNMGITRWLGTPQFAALMKTVDPYSYRARLTMPKLIVNATGDQYFAPDSSQFYFSGLDGEKYLRYVPNTDHSLGGITAFFGSASLITFVKSISADTPRPVYSWRSFPDGPLRVQSTTKPLAVKLWQAINEHARDFRLQTIGKAFTSTDLAAGSNGTYAARVSPPAHGYAAYFIELTYNGEDGLPFIVTTDVHVTPDILPFKLPLSPAPAR